MKLNINYDLNSGLGGISMAAFGLISEDKEYFHSCADSWYKKKMENFEGSPYYSRISDDNSEALYVFDDSLVYIMVYRGTLHCQSTSSDLNKAKEAIKRIKDLYPEDEEYIIDEVYINFWSYGTGGPQSIRRSIDANSWEEIKTNYPESIQPSIERVIKKEFDPETAGQLILWSGEPGTGKTTAIRALAREWRSWCSIEYIADPEKFFGAYADYMLTVMLSNSHGQDDKWKLLVLEDSGELIAKDARVSSGQALSRFLNVVDGLIGRGLKVMVLVTTNEELGELNDAASRPGRCAARVEFPVFSGEESTKWFNQRGIDGDFDKQRTLAELYGHLNGLENVKKEKKMGFLAV